jgi:hypothetical protein
MGTSSPDCCSLDEVEVVVRLSIVCVSSKLDVSDVVVADVAGDDATVVVV